MKHDYQQLADELKEKGIYYKGVLEAIAPSTQGRWNSGDSS